MTRSTRTPTLAAMVALSAAALATAAEPTTMPTTGPAAAAISWADAGKHVGETVTVTGKVVGTHAAGKNIVLNVGKDFPEKDRFTVMMPFDEAAGSADDQFVGKTMTVTGKVKLYKGVAEITTRKAADVKLTGGAAPTTAPAMPDGH